MPINRILIINCCMQWWQFPAVQIRKKTAPQLADTFAERFSTTLRLKLKPIKREACTLFVLWHSSGRPFIITPTVSRSNKFLGEKKLSTQLYFPQFMPHHYKPHTGCFCWRVALWVTEMYDGPKQTLQSWGRAISLSFSSAEYNRPYKQTVIVSNAACKFLQLVGVEKNSFTRANCFVLFTTHDHWTTKSTYNIVVILILR